MKRFRYVLSLFLISFFLFRCDKGNDKNADTATYGTIKIAADESYFPIVSAELDVFKAIYKYADITPVYTSEEEGFQLLVKDSVRLMIASRTLSESDLKVFEKQKIIPRVYKIAQDGVALIVNKSNSDSMITFNQVKKIFKGEISTWSDLGKSKNKNNITVVFDNNNSSNLRFLKDTLELQGNFSPNVFSAKSNKEVVEYVKTHENAMGVIGVNWISDADDSTTVSFLNSIQVVGIASTDSPAGPEDYYQPYQAFIAQGLYPLRRNLYIISKEARVGLGTGFVSFVTSERGQRIVLKAGLVPANVPLRIVKVKKESI